MILSNEIEALQRQFDQLAECSGDEILARYAMQQPQRPTGFYWQSRWLAGRVLRWLQSKGILRADPWPASLKHAATSRDAKPLLIWAVSADPDTLREACKGISDLVDDLPGFAPVLVTDRADFAFFSRQRWLVEYIPRLAGEGELFEIRKARFLARLYRGSPVLPVTAGLASASQAEEIHQWIVRRKP
jgi:hypothetical protein